MELPRPPDDPEAKNIIDKLAQFVARNGPEFEKMTKSKQEGNPKFAFLFGGENYAYYDFKVRAEQQILRNTGGQQPSGRPGQQQWQQHQGPGGWGPPGGQGPMGNQGGPGPGGPPPGPGWGQQWRPNSPGVGGPPMGSNMGGPSMGSGPGMNSGGSNNYGGGYGNGGGDYRGPNSDYGGTSYGGGPNSGPPGGFGRFDESPNRRGILGGPPGSNQGPGPGPNQGPNCWVGQMSNPPPVKPDTSMLDGQISTAKASIKALQDQIVQSESNLTAQWTVLQQQERDKVQESVAKARVAQLEEQSRSCNVKLSELENLLQPIIETCTKDSISSGKSWIFQHGTNFNSNQVICDYLALKGTKESSPFSQKLHLIYLINDVLHHCVRKNNETLKAALEAVAVPMYCAAADRAEEEDMKKLTKLMSLWESKNKFFSEEKLNDMLNPGRTIKKFRSKLQEEFPELVKPQEQGTTSTYNGYKQQHEQFVNHANNSIDEQQKQLEALEQELVVINMNFEETLKNWQKVNPQAAASQQTTAGGGGGRRSRWDRTAAQQAAVSQQGGWDMSRPPPNLSQPPPHLMEPKIPSLPYFELPAGLMVPLVKMEDSGYKPIDPSLIRLPPPQPPNERLLAAVDLFYAPPSHERPRDPEGWERLGLYEWARDKQDAIQKKKEAIENGTRSPSPPPSPAKTSREDSPEQTVPGEEEVPRKRKRYRSRTSSKERRRSRSRSKERRRSRTRSKSRESTPVPGEDEGRRSRTRSRSRSRSGDRRGRRRNDSERSRGGGRDLSPTGSGSPEGGALPSFLTRRSPTPPGGQLGGSNKGHQMMQRMGWKGQGLGSQESGITEPISGGEVRDKQDQYKGMGIEKDPFEDFRKMRAGGYYKRVKDYQGK